MFRGHCPQDLREGISWLGLDHVHQHLLGAQQQAPRVALLAAGRRHQLAGEGEGDLHFAEVGEHLLGAAVHRAGNVLPDKGLDRRKLIEIFQKLVQGVSVVRGDGILVLEQELVRVDELSHRDVDDRFGHRHHLRVFVHIKPLFWLRDAAGSRDEPPELLVGVLQVLVHPAEMRVLPIEGLAGGRVLQHFGDGAQAAAVVGMQGHPGRDVHDVEAIGGHHRWVHEAVVEQVPHDLVDLLLRGLGEFLS